MRIAPLIILVFGGLGLGACGDTTGERLAYGGAAGAGAAVVTNSNVAAGAALGAAANVLYCEENPGAC